MERKGLARALTVMDYFVLGFGCIVGVGWVVLAGDWITMGGGPIPAALGFLLGTLILIPVAWVYGELVPMLPVAGGELSWTYRAFGSSASYWVGWLVALAYVAVCPWEAIAVGRIIDYFFPGLQAYPLYSVLGSTIYLPHLLIGLLLCVLLTAANYYGVKTAANIQKYLTFILFGAGLIAILGGFISGHPQNLMPLFDKPGSSMLAGILTVFAMAPFFLAGFDTIPQAAEEGSERINYTNLGKVVAGVVMCAGLFYVLVILAVGWVAPWHETVKESFPTATVFAKILRHPVLADIVVLGALCGLLTTWNALILASARVLFALGRGRLLFPQLGAIHPRYRTPHVAVLVVGVISFIGPFIGKKGLIPIADVASVGFVVAWLASSLSALRLRMTAPQLERPFAMPGGTFTAWVAVIVSAIWLGVILVPGSPGALVWPVEYGTFLIYILIGLVLYLLLKALRESISEEERANMMLKPPEE